MDKEEAFRLLLFDFLCDCFRSRFLSFITKRLAITHIFYARQIQGKKQSLSRKFHEFSRMGFKNTVGAPKRWDDSLFGR